MQPDQLTRQTLERRIGIAVCLLFGVARAGIGRYSLDSDGISYLDLADTFNRHDWRNFLSAYWSPLYPSLLAISRHILPTSKRWELPSAHVLNFAIYVVTLICFEFFYAQLRDLLISANSGAENGKFTLVAERSFWALAHALFLWTSLDLITIWGVCPDLCIAAFVYLIAGVILRFDRRFDSGTNWKAAAILGAVLGVSYWTKAVMFPLAFAFMLIAVLRAPNLRSAINRGVIVALVFAAFAGPLVAALSAQKHRLTFGDSGRINYAVFVSPGGVMRNWQGEPVWGITAAHPTRQILADPPMFEFAEPIGGTFPPFYDPSYWQEGRVPVFRLGAQLNTAARHLLSYADLLLRQENALLAAFLTFLLIAGKDAGRSLAKTSPLVLISASGFGIYMLVHAEARFFGAYIAVLWLALLSPLRMPNELRRMAQCLLLAVAAVLVIAVADNTARAVRDNGPFSAMPEVLLSDRLDSLGVRPGDRIALLGDVSLYAARLSHAKIVAEIMPADAPSFWRLPAEKKEIVLQKFAESGARIILAGDPGPAVQVDSSWHKIEGHAVYLRVVEANVTRHEPTH